MADRRQVIIGGLALSAAPAVSFASTNPAAIYKAVYDERLAAGRAFALDALCRGWTVAAIRGDVTELWFHDLDLRWKQGPAAVAGVTSASSLFVLERLAWDAGLRVTARAEHPSEPVVSWLIAPKPRA